MDECSSAFQKLKEYLSWPPIMSKLDEDEVLFAYIVVASHVVSLVSVQDDNRVQKLIYYVSKSLHEVDVRYLPLERAILVVVYVIRKLPHYFQAHIVVVLTQLPLRSLLQKVDYIGRVEKWAMILEDFDIKYMPRTSIKGQTLTDLVAEFAKLSFEENSERLSMDGKSVGMVSL